MPPTPPVAKVLRVRTLWTDDAGTEHGTRQFYSYPGTVASDTDLNTFCTNLISYALPSLLPALTSEKTVTSFIAEDLTSDTSPVGESSPLAAGTRAGDYLPASVVAICDYQVARRHRGGQPRGALPFGAWADLLNAQTWKSDSVAEFLTAITGFISNALGCGSDSMGDLVHVDVSYRNDGTPRLAPVAYPIAGYFVNPRVGAQRRRLGRSSI